MQTSTCFRRKELLHPRVEDGLTTSDLISLRHEVCLNSFGPDALVPHLHGMQTWAPRGDVNLGPSDFHGKLEDQPNVLPPP